MTSAESYPIRIDAQLDRPLSRWLWLVKWLLAIPHYIVLTFLWVAFVLLSVVAFFAILFTGRYPRGIFNFNVGVLRWTWRVQYYAYGTLGTDHYPPFTLIDVPDYPAHLDVAYPPRLSRGLVLVKWWLLAIPHYLVVGLFIGGGTWLALDDDDTTFNWAAGGLVGILVLVAGVVLAFSGRYPQAIYDFVLGMNRWVFRVAVYAGLMTDTYPPFRLDMGGQDPGTIPSAPQPRPDEPPPTAALHRWTPGRIVSAVIGSVLALTSLGFLTGGGALLWADQTQRDPGGYLSSSIRIDSDGYAVTTDDISVRGDDLRVLRTPELIGDIRIKVTPERSESNLFLGIAPAEAAAAYLAEVRHTVITNPGDTTAGRLEQPGNAPTVTPLATTIWTEQTTGPGAQSLVWDVPDGRWTVVVMNADGSRPVAARAEIGATVPALPWIALGVLTAGAILLILGVVLIAFAATRAAHDRPDAPREPAPIGG